MAKVKQKEATVFVGRINFTSQMALGEFFGSKKINFDDKLVKFIQEDAPAKLIVSPDFKWRFGGIQQEDNLIFGKFGKIGTSDTHMVYDEKSKDFIETERKEYNATVSHFCIFLKEHLIIFERTRSPGYKEFMIVFREAFSRYVDVKDCVSIDLIKNKVEIAKIIKQADRIVNLDFTIRPSNPDHSDDIKRIDDELKTMRAEKARLSFDSWKKGLDVQSPTILRSSIALCDRGYGDYRIQYVKGEEERRLDSKTQVVREKMKISKNSEQMKKEYQRIRNQTMDMLDENE
jgi:hypothetical protein